MKKKKFNLRKFLIKNKILLFTMKINYSIFKKK